MKQVFLLLCISMSSGAFATAPFPPGSPAEKDSGKERPAISGFDPTLLQDRPVSILVTDEEGHIVDTPTPDEPVNTDDLEPGTYQVHYQFENGFVADRRIIVY